MVDVDRYSRQRLFPGIGDAGQERIRRASVLVVGCGALGSVIAETLTRAGVGRLRIADRDIVELSNLQRQALFDLEDVRTGIPKAEAARRRLAAINPEVAVEAVVRDVDASCVRELAGDVDLILDGTDNFETRYLLNDVAVALGKPWVYGAVVGSYGMAVAVVPNVTPCFACLFPELPPPGATPTCDTGGVLGPIVGMVASLQCTEAMKLMVGVGPSQRMVCMDVWKHDYRVLDTKGSRNPHCPVCVDRTFAYLESGRGSKATRLCGHDAVQVSWAGCGQAVDFEALAPALTRLGHVTQNAFVLRFESAEARFTLFRDGRAIVYGVNDEGRAREICARFIG